jgi:hypothetical protein
MKPYLITVVERDGTRYTVPALAHHVCDAQLMVLDSIGRVVGIQGRPA